MLHHYNIKCMNHVYLNNYLNSHADSAATGRLAGKCFLDADFFFKRYPPNITFL